MNPAISADPLAGWAGRAGWPRERLRAGTAGPSEDACTALARLIALATSAICPFPFFFSPLPPDRAPRRLGLRQNACSRLCGAEAAFGAGFSAVEIIILWADQPIKKIS